MALETETHQSDRTNREPNTNRSLIGAEAFPSVETLPHERCLSSSIWNINWNDYFPFNINQKGFVAEYSTHEEFSAFAKVHFARVFRQDSYQTSFLWSESGTAKTRYYKEAGDFFVFKMNQKTIGGFVGTPIDWSSYYLRSFALLPEYEGHQILSLFLKHLFKCLEEVGVERIEGDTSPSNLTIIQILTRLRFNITGMTLSERWGSQLRLSKFLSTKHEQVFLDQFCFGARPQLER